MHMTLTFLVARTDMPHDGHVYFRVEDRALPGSLAVLDAPILCSVLSMWSKAPRLSSASSASPGLVTPHPTRLSCSTLRPWRIASRLNVLLW